MNDRSSAALFERLVESAGGAKGFAAGMGLSSRQVHRMLSGAQANPVGRMREALAAGTPAAAEKVLDHLAEACGGYFVRLVGDLDDAGVNAVKEAAEAIVAISEGRSTPTTVNEIREAIAALAALERVLQWEGKQHDDGMQS